MQGVDRELADREDQLQSAYDKALKMIIKHGYSSYDISHHPDDPYAGKTFMELLRHDRYAETLSPASSPRRSPATSKMRSISQKSPRTKTTIPGMRSSLRASGDESEDEGQSESETPRQSGSESSEVSDTEKRKKTRGRSRSSSLSRIFRRSASNLDESESGDEATWQQSNASASETDEGEAKKKKNFLSFMSLRKAPKIKDIIVRQVPATAEEEIYFEDLLDPCSLDEMILMTLQLGVDRDERYKIRRVDNDGKTKYLPERCGGSNVFVEMIGRDGKLHGRSILLSLRAMRKPIHPQARQNFLAIQNVPYQKFFQLMRKHNIAFRQGLAADIYIRRKKMQHIIKHHKDIDKLTLMRLLDPELYREYHIAHEQSEVMAVYNQLSINKPLVVETISPQAQVEDYQKFYVEILNIQDVITDISAGNCESFNKVTSRECKLEIVNQLSLKIIPRKHHSFIFSLLENVNVKLKRLDLSGGDLSEDALERLLQKQGSELRYLDLTACEEAVKPTITYLVSKYCPKLTDLILCDTNVKTISSQLNVTHLDLSRTFITNSTLADIQRFCSNLRSLCLAETAITSIDVALDVTHLDLSGCRITDTFLATLREKCPRLRYLTLTKCTNLRTINLLELDFLYELNVSLCPNLIEIKPVHPDVEKRIGSPRKMTAVQSTLKFLRADNCPKLECIELDDALNLITLHANNTGLASVVLSTGQTLKNLRVVELMNNLKLRTLKAKPKNLTRFVVTYSKNLMSPLSDVFCRHLLAQVLGTLDDTATPEESSSALGILFRVKENARKWMVDLHGEHVLTGLPLPNLDATCANLSFVNFSGSDLIGANFTNAKMNDACLSHANLENITFGVLPPLLGYKQMVTAIAQNSDGSLIATGDASGKVILTSNQKTIYEFNHDHAITALQFSPDDKIIAVASMAFNDKDTFKKDNYSIYLYNAAAPYNQTNTFENVHSADIRALAFARNGNLISASEDCTVKIQTGLVQKVLDAKQGQVLSIAINPKQESFATGGSDGTIIIWNSITGKLTLTFKAHNRSVNTIAYSPDGKYLISAGEDKEIKIFSVSKKYQNPISLTGHKSVITSVKISPDSRLIFSVDALGYKEMHALMVWQIETGELMQQFGLQLGSRAIDCAPKKINDAWIVQCGCDDKQVRQFIVRDNGMSYQLERSDFSSTLITGGLEINEAFNISNETIDILESMGVDCDELKERNEQLVEETQDDSIDDEPVVVVAGPGYE
ncbi:MAG: pentapeptide repeat-containing protein [Pseudomonadota bacterium]|nr:pentapeptide repeat-containing protein [Pseudomonadota bacterium]